MGWGALNASSPASSMLVPTDPRDTGQGDSGTHTLTHPASLPPVVLRVHAMEGTRPLGDVTASLAGGALVPKFTPEDGHCIRGIWMCCLLGGLFPSLCL